MIRVERLWIDLRARRDLGRILADTKALLDRAARELRLFPRTRRWFVVPGLWVSVFWSYRRRWWTAERWEKTRTDSPRRILGLRFGWFSVVWSRRKVTTP
jgi:hypothetical protein